MQIEAASVINTYKSWEMLTFVCRISRKVDSTSLNLHTKIIIFLKLSVGFAAVNELYDQTYRHNFDLQNNCL